MTIRVLIVEDHNLVREALRSLVAGMPGFAVADAVSDGKQAIRAAVTLQPELVLMDVSLPGMSGLDATAEIRRRSPDVHVVFLTLTRNEEFIREAFQIGAEGYLLKSASLEEFKLALNFAVRGKKYISSELLSAMAEGSGSGHNQASLPAWKNLSGRERSILKLIAEGNTNRATAEYLCISTKTVEKHRSSLMRKLGLRSAAELVVVALEMGLVERPGIAGRRTRAMPNADMGAASLRPDALGLFC